METTLTAEPDGLSAYCPVFQDTLELVGRRWSGAIIRSLLAGRMRFSDVLADIPGLSDRLLSERLRELEGRGLVARTVFPETPVRIEYQLTEKGRGLDDIVRSVDNWATRWAGDADHGAHAGEPQPR